MYVVACERNAMVRMCQCQVQVLSRFLTAEPAAMTSGSANHQSRGAGNPAHSLMEALDAREP